MKPFGFLLLLISMISAVLACCNKTDEIPQEVHFMIEATVNGDKKSFTETLPMRWSLPRRFFWSLGPGVVYYDFIIDHNRFMIEEPEPDFRVNVSFNQLDSFPIVSNKWYHFETINESETYYISSTQMYCFNSGNLCFVTNCHPEKPISFSVLFDDCTFCSVTAPYDNTIPDTLIITNGRLDIYECLYKEMNEIHHPELPDFLTSPF